MSDNVFEQAVTELEFRTVAVSDDPLATDEVVNEFVVNLEFAEAGAQYNGDTSMDPLEGDGDLVRDKLEACIENNKAKILESNPADGQEFQILIAFRDPVDGDGTAYGVVTVRYDKGAGDLVFVPEKTTFAGYEQDGTGNDFAANNPAKMEEIKNTISEAYKGGVDGFLCGDEEEQRLAAGQQPYTFADATI